MIKLNNSSYTHLRIRYLCFQLEKATGMKLMTDLSKEFKFIQFKSKLSYLNIFYEDNLYSTLNYKLNKAEAETIEEIIIILNFLITGQKVQILLKKLKK